MRKVFIIGIGAGNPDYITVQAINALNEVDVVFVMDKGVKKLTWSACARKSASVTSRTSRTGPSRLRIRSAIELRRRMSPASKHGTSSGPPYTRD